MEKHTITIIMEGGIIQDICGIPANVKIVVQDYDVEGVDEEDIEMDVDGEQCTKTIWEVTRI